MDKIQKLKLEWYCWCIKTNWYNHLELFKHWQLRGIFTTSTGYCIWTGTLGDSPCEVCVKIIGVGVSFFEDSGNRLRTGRLCASSWDARKLLNHLRNISSAHQFLKSFHSAKPWFLKQLEQTYCQRGKLHWVLSKSLDSVLRIRVISDS